MRRIALLLCGLLVAPLHGWSAQSAHDRPLRVAVAANFATTLADLIDTYTAMAGENIATSSASTGALYTQVIHGAPYDLLLAADSARPERLVREGHTLGPARTYALGTLVLAYQPAQEALAQQGIGVLLSTPGLNLAMANPELAPYGVAADAVLARFADAEPRRLTGANVGQAMQMLVAGGADAAFVAASFEPARHLPIPAHWYPAIEQQAVVLAGAAHPERAQAFLNWLTGPVARNLIELRGYGLPNGHD